MGRSYAGILGTIAFTVVLLQGCIHAAPLRPVLESAILSTLAFSAIGYAIGALAGWIVEGSIEDHEIEALLAQLGYEPFVSHVEPVGHHQLGTQ